MKNKTISITDGLYEKLKQEENASSLIVKLLNEYYNMKVNEKLSLEDRKKLLEIRKIELEAKRKIGEIKYGESF